jgi:hypothetical protein
MTTEPSSLPVVDSDDPVTWPPSLADLVHRLADSARRDGCVPKSFQDLNILSFEATALAHLEGHLVRARHSTRLLHHEKDAILTQGLRLLTADLVNDRLDQAHKLGYLPDPDYEVLRAVNETIPEHRGFAKREDQVCLTLSTAPMVHDVGGIHRLLSYWGGEAIYRKHEGAPEVAALLRSLGAPAIVTALLDFADPGVGTHQVFPSVIHVLVGKALGHEQADADVLYRAAIPPQRIESIVSPGDPAYDRFPGLPRS